MNFDIKNYNNIFTSYDKQFFYDKYLDEYTEYELSAGYLAGLIDGDGSICCSKSYPHYIKLEISQCDFLVIFLIQQKFPGNLRKIEGKENKRNQYKITYINNLALPILEFIQDNILLKKDQCKLSIQNINTMRNIENKEILSNNSEKIILLNKEHQERNIPENMSWEYISGLFDAEGCVIGGKCEVTITQKNSINLLQKIKKFIGFGKIRYPRYYIEKKIDAYNFFENINQYLIIKKQYNHYIEYIKENGKKYNSDEDPYRIKYKHNFEISNDFINLLNIKYKKKTYQDNIILRKTLSDKKKGINNPNFGKERNKEHSQKISENTFAKNRSISDEIIQEILNMKGQKTQEDIAKIYNISRASVYKIHTGKLVKTTEYQKYVENKEHENKKEWIKSFGYSKKEADIINGALKKRIIDGKIMALIWYYGKLREIKRDYPIKITSENIIKYLEKPITVNLVKNIWNKKTKLYKFDFKDLSFTWENYLENTIDENSEWIDF